MEENYFNVNILPILMEKILQEVGHRLIGNISTDNDVPDGRDVFLFSLLLTGEVISPSSCFLFVGALIL